RRVRRACLDRRHRFAQPGISLRQPVVGVQVLWLDLERPLVLRHGLLEQAVAILNGRFLLGNAEEGVTQLVDHYVVAREVELAVMHPVPGLQTLLTILDPLW